MPSDLDHIDPEHAPAPPASGLAHTIQFLRWLATRKLNMRLISNEELQWRAQRLLEEITAECTYAK